MKPLEITEEKINAFILLSSPPLPEKASTLFDYIKKDDEVLEFERNLHISGNIDNSFIFTKGELICDGNVSNSVIVTANGLALKGSVKDSKLYSNKRMDLGSVSSTDIFCLEGVKLSADCRNSNLFIINDLNCSDADFIDSTAICGGKIEILNCKSDGRNIKLIADYNLTSERFKEILNALSDRLNKTITKLGQLIDTNMTTDSEDFILKRSLLENQKDYILKKISHIEPNTNTSEGNNIIKIHGQISEGALLDIKGVKYEIQSNMAACIFEELNGVIEYSEIISE